MRGVEIDRQHRVPVFRGHIGQGLVAGDASVVHHNVDAVRQLLDQLRGRVIGADIQGNATPAQPCGEGVEIGLGLRHIQQHNFCTVARQGFGNRRADATGSSGHQGLAPGQRARPVVHLGRAGAQAQHLAADIGTFRREEKPQRTFQLILGAFCDIQQLQSATVAQLLGQGPAEAFEGALGAGGKRLVEAFRGAAENHQVCAVVEIFQQRLKEFAQLLELVGVLQVAGVEQHRLELGTMPGNPRRGLQRFGAVAVDGLGEFIGKPLHLGRERAAAQQQGAVHRTQAPGLPALQAYR